MKTSDRRVHPRFPSWERAVVQWGDNGPAMRGLVIDLSQGGAKIEVAEQLECDNVTLHLRHGDDKMALPFTIVGADPRGATTVVRGFFSALDAPQRAFIWNLLVRWHNEFDKRQQWLATRIDDPAA